MNQSELWKTLSSIFGADEKRTNPAQTGGRSLALTANSLIAIVGVFGLMGFWLQFKVRFSLSHFQASHEWSAFPYLRLLKPCSYEARNGLGCAAENRTVELSKKT